MTVAELVLGGISCVGGAWIIYTSIHEWRDFRRSVREVQMLKQCVAFSAGGFDHALFRVTAEPVMSAGYALPLCRVSEQNIEFAHSIVWKVPDVDVCPMCVLLKSVIAANNLVDTEPKSVLAAKRLLEAQR